MRSILARFEIVTPMFLGGADHAASRIRESSVKGALAFWWRALNFAQFVESVASDDREKGLKEALKRLQDQERVLFGGPEGQGSFLLRVVSTKPLSTFESSNPLRDGASIVGEGARYLGYGLMDAFGGRNTVAGRLSRSCLKHGQEFEVQIVFRPTTRPDDISEIVRALTLFGLIGGLGSRVRRGWGSVALKNLRFKGGDGEESWEPITDVECYKNRLKSAVDSLSTGFGRDFPLTAFAKETDIRVGDPGYSSALDALKNIGEDFVGYRARGKPKGTFGNVSVDASFEDDHDWFKECGKFSLPSGRGSNVPKRSAFGLPHNYDKYFGVSGSEEISRRASPLFFHVHQIDDGFFPIILFFPTSFLPTDEVAVWENRDDPEHKSTRRYIFDPQVISDFLDGVKHSDVGGASVPRGPNVHLKKLQP